MTSTNHRPKITTPLPGPKAAELIARDAKAMSPSFTRAYPFVMDHGQGCWATDVDGNVFLDFTAGIAVCVWLRSIADRKSRIANKVGVLCQ